MCDVVLNYLFPTWPTWAIILHIVYYMMCNVEELGLVRRSRHSDIIGEQCQNLGFQREVK